MNELTNIINKRGFNDSTGSSGQRLTKRKSIVPKKSNMTTSISNAISGGIPTHIDDEDVSFDDNDPSISRSSVKLEHQFTGHRPVTSCTHCRQHKIKCNASDNFPDPCSRCDRMGLTCEIDPQFRPKKGSQLQNLRKDVDDLKLKIDCLIKNDSLILQSLKNVNFSGNNNENNSNNKTDHSISNTPDTTGNEDILKSVEAMTTTHLSKNTPNVVTPNVGSRIAVQTYLVSEPPLLSGTISPVTTVGTTTNINSPLSVEGYSAEKSNIIDNADNKSRHHHIIATTNTIQPLPSPHESIDEFVLGDVRITLERANYLHDLFITRYLPYFPIMQSTSATKLCNQSQLLFWTVMLTASISDPEPTLYIKLSSLIKQLAIETCWLRTPRSTHISQALLILCIWPLPNQKILDDCSYRFVGLAKSLSSQLGLHRGEFISEFTRSQTSLPDAEKWRTRAWLGIYFSELCWASILGLPPTSQADYLIENARMGQDQEDTIDDNENNDDKSGKHENGNENENENEGQTNIDKNFFFGESGNSGKSSDRDKIYKLPSRFRRLICLAHFQNKLYNVMGSSIIRSDGLMEPKDRAGALTIMSRELKRLEKKLNFTNDVVVHIYYLYVKLTVCCFAFLPKTPTEDQTQYVTEAYLYATKVVTLLAKLLEVNQLNELPIFVRQAVTYAALILFKLQLTPYLLNKYMNSARQSIVTVHRLYRNQLATWATRVENDISRTASVLEKLNFVLITHPEIFIVQEGIITRMRSHLTGSLFYDLVYCVHEARRRETDPKYNADALKRFELKKTQNGGNSPINFMNRKLYPLPLYNQISKEHFKTITKTTPNGTSVTKLVPTTSAIKEAKELAKGSNGNDGAVVEINGIPISMLNETGSVLIDGHLNSSELNTVLPHGFDEKGIKKLYPFTRNNIALNLETSMPQSVELESPYDRRHPPNMTIVAKDVAMQRSNSIPAPHSAHLVSPGSLKPARHSPQVLKNSNSLFSNIATTAPPQVDQVKNIQQISADNTNNLSIERNSDPIANLNFFLETNNVHQSNPDINFDGNAINNFTKPTASTLSDIDNFFLQQSTGWIEGNSTNDDFLGWFDMNMETEF